MEDLIKALQIFLKYGNPRYPTHCEHDELIVSINPNLISEDDKMYLEKLSFRVREHEEYFYSNRFGSC